MRLLFSILLLGIAGLTGCAHSDWPSSKSSPNNWPASDTDQATIDARFEKASTKPLGSQADVTEIKKVILANKDNFADEVREIRWLSSDLVMAKAGNYAANVGSRQYTFVLEKRAGAWKIIACYMDWIS